jgi:hypothetical protein
MYKMMTHPGGITVESEIEALAFYHKIGFRLADPEVMWCMVPNPWLSNRLPFCVIDLEELLVAATACDGGGDAASQQQQDAQKAARGCSDQNGGGSGGGTQSKHQSHMYAKLSIAELAAGFQSLVLEAWPSG